MHTNKDDSQIWETVSSKRNNKFSRRGREQTSDNTPRSTTKSTYILKNNKIESIPLINTAKHCKPIRNHIVKHFNTSHDTWEFVYFKYIFDLYKIFSDEIKTLNIDINIDTFHSLYLFSKFIKKCSSGKISPYVNTIQDHIDTDLEKFYLEYTIKRNNK